MKDFTKMQIKLGLSEYFRYLCPQIIKLIIAGLDEQNYFFEVTDKVR